MKKKEADSQAVKAGPGDARQGARTLSLLSRYLAARRAEISSFLCASTGDCSYLVLSAYFCS